jgi:DNA-binding NarL/FixJ family response regulator
MLEQAAGGREPDAEGDEMQGVLEGVPLERYSLTSLEVTILQLVAEGFPSKDIAARVGRAKPTIEGSIRLMCAKLGARSRAHLVSRAYSDGILGSRKKGEP